MRTNSLSPGAFQRLLNLWKYYYFRQPISFAHSAIAGLSVACQIGFCFLYFELRRSLIPLKLSTAEVVFTVIIIFLVLALPFGLLAKRVEMRYELKRKEGSKSE